MKTKCSLASIAALLLLSVSAPAVTFITTGIYDENVNQTNSVDTNASGNLLSSTSLNDVAGFKTAVAAAFTAGLGGVVNFDLPNGSPTNVTENTTGIQASYAGGTKTLNAATITSNADNKFNYSSFGTLTPISGASATASDSRGAIPFTADNSPFTAFRLAFTGPQAVKTVGFTLLSRDSLAQNVLVEWLINGNNTTPAASDTEAMAAGKTLDDTFFSYTATGSNAITGVRVTFQQNTTGDRRHAIDDFGFITVPEPGSALLVLLGGAGMLGLVRRRN